MSPTRSVALVALLVLGLAAILVSANFSDCYLSRVRPNRFRANYVATLDGKNMARFSGYIATSNSRYYTVNAESMRVDHNEGKIYLADKCVDFEMDYREDAQTGIASVSNLKWNFRDARLGSKSYGHCSASLFEHKFPANEKRYSCDSMKSHPCMADDNNGTPVKIAEFNIVNFELELYGDEDKINAGDFSKPKFEPSSTQ